MKYTHFINKNKPQLLFNYSSRSDYITEPFQEFCKYVFKGLQIGAWLPLEYTCNIEYDKCKHEGFYQPEEYEINVSESYTCIHCGINLPLPDKDDQL